MGTFGVVEAHPVFDDTPGLVAILDFFEIDGFLFQGSPQAINEDVVEVSAKSIHPLPGRRIRRMLPKGEIRTPASARVMIQTDPVNWRPWSVFMI